MSWEPLAIVAVPFAAAWVWRSIWRPMAPCRWCRGQRKVGDDERWRNVDCSHCGNSRERMTLGGRMVRNVSRSSRWGR